MEKDAFSRPFLLAVRLYVWLKNTPTRIGYGALAYVILGVFSVDVQTYRKTQKGAEQVFFRYCLNSVAKTKGA